MMPGPLGERSVGDPKAPVTVIEYASMTCPHCQRFHAETYPALKAKYIDAGKVYWTEIGAIGPGPGRVMGSPKPASST